MSGVLHFFSERFISEGHYFHHLAETVGDAFAVMLGNLPHAGALVLDEVGGGDGKQPPLVTPLQEVNHRGECHAVAHYRRRLCAYVVDSEEFDGGEGFKFFQRLFEQEDIGDIFGTYPLHPLDVPGISMVVEEVDEVAHGEHEGGFAVAVKSVEQQPGLAAGVGEPFGGGSDIVCCLGSFLHAPAVVVDLCKVCRLQIL